MSMKKRAPRNRTLTCTEEELDLLAGDLLHLQMPISIEDLAGRIVQQEVEGALPFMPSQFVDLLVIDPPYNLTKNYNGLVFKSKQAAEYVEWFEDTLRALLPTLKKEASVYVCSDWRTSNLIFPVLEKHFLVRNRITWEREKGRGAKSNWKNNTEDIWYCTMSDDYHFDVEAVKVKRRVIAPYKSEDGSPKDWENSKNGKFRLTHPSNLWSDITIPFWSMPENTDHPTQKPEKLIAKLILASSRKGDFVFDPFAGSGTTAVVAKKLGRQFCGIEINREYACWALKRLATADSDSTIQGFSEGVFWERNSMPAQKSSKPSKHRAETLGLFND